MIGRGSLATSRTGETLSVGSTHHTLQNRNEEITGCSKIDRDRFINYPNALVSITDNLASTSLPAGESFTNLMSATYGQVIRGVAFVPTTQPADALPEVPWQPILPITAMVVGGGFFAGHRRLRVRASI